jgi:AcrR family transcriptional regulator
MEIILVNDDNQTSVNLSSRRDRRHRETRDEILREARRLVGQQGASAISVREIATNMGFTPPALYRYFPGGRDEILEALATSGLELLADHLRHVPSDLPAHERLLEIAVAYFEFAHEHRRELDIILDSVVTMEGREIDEISLFGSTGIFSVIEETLNGSAEVGAADVPVHDESTLVILHGLWSLAHGMAVLEPLHPHIFRTHARDLIRAYVNGLVTVWPETE